MPILGDPEDEFLESLGEWFALKSH